MARKLRQAIHCGNTSSIAPATQAVNALGMAGAMTHSGRDSELRIERILDGRVQRFSAQFELACE